MRGIRVRQQYDKGGKAAPSPIPKGQSRFAFIFRPILPRLAEYIWVVNLGDWPFDFPHKEKFERIMDAFPRYGIIPRDTLLPRYAKYLKEDWLSLYGFR